MGSGTCSTEVTFIKLTTNFLGDADCFKPMVYSEELEMPPDRDLLGEYAESKMQMLGEFITTCKHGKRVDTPNVELCSECDKVYDPSRPEKIPYNIKIQLLKRQIKCARIDLSEIKRKINETKNRIYGMEHPSGSSNP